MPETEVEARVSPASLKKSLERLELEVKELKTASQALVKAIKEYEKLEGEYIMPKGNFHGIEFGDD